MRRRQQADGLRASLAEGKSSSLRPAYYAGPRGALGDWWTLLHPPYTAWHLSYVVIGACLAPVPSVARLGLALGAFFLAVGLSAHALDELHGRPLRTDIPRAVLWVVAAVGLAGALALGVIGVMQSGWPLIVFMVVGPVLVVGYNVELFGGLLHNDLGFAAGWGAFPVLTAYVFQTGSLAWPPVLVAASAVLLSLAQRSSSARARLIRRRASSISGQLRTEDGATTAIDGAFLLAPVERTLRCTAWGMVLLAAGLAVARLR